MAASDVDLRSLDKGFAKMIKSGEDLKPVWRKLRPALRKDQRQHFKDQKDSSGASWAPLASSTRARRMSKGGRAGKFTKRGKLKKSAARKLDRILSARLVSGAKVKIERTQTSITARPKGRADGAGVHNEGGRVGRGARVPRREFMYISDPLAQRAAALIKEQITEAFNKGG